MRDMMRSDISGKRHESGSLVWSLVVVVVAEGASHAATARGSAGSLLRRSLQPDPVGCGRDGTRRALQPRTSAPSSAVSLQTKKSIIYRVDACAYTPNRRRHTRSPRRFLRGGGRGSPAALELLAAQLHRAFMWLLVDAGTF
ncbi:hypothetical protein DFJ73DRAFT_766973 [Zopfochytrium polystomum]|nr:hypothetical protein DFJ73DRAFT_766973 [Zopfochytrium polystomum]